MLLFPLHFAAAATPETVQESLFLTGDAGELDAPALAPLRKQLEAEPQKSVVVFLGDNIYRAGLPPPFKRTRRSAEQILLQQINTGKGVALRTIFVPGNHDWDFHGADGWNAVIRQQQYVEAELGPGSYFPRQACPGPVLAYESPRMRLIAVDSHWWMHGFTKPSGPTSECGATEPADFQAALGKLLREAKPGQVPILIQHHPLKSYGHHGLGKQCPVDIGCPVYADYVALVRQELEKHSSKPICTGGHDHSLEIIQGDQACRLYLVSGAASKPTSVSTGKDLVFGGSTYGFLRLDLMSTGNFRVKAIAVDAKAPSGNEVFEASFVG